MGELTYMQSHKPPQMAITVTPILLPACLLLLGSCLAAPEELGSLSRVKRQNIVSNVLGAANTAITGVCSERLRMCGEPWGCCCKDPVSCKIPLCRWHGYTWALVILGPIVALLLIAGVVAFCLKKRSSGAA